MPLSSYIHHNMRRILIAFLIALSSISYGQGITPGSTPTGTVWDKGGHVVDSVFALPFRDTVFPTWYGSQRKSGAIVVKSSNNTLYFYSGSWRSVGGVDTSAWHKSGDSIGANRFIGPTNDQNFEIRRNGISFLVFNTFDGVKIGRDAFLMASGNSIGRDSYNTGFGGTALGGGYNEGSQAFSAMVGAINTGDRGVVIGRGAYANKQDCISLGTTSRSTHVGNFIANDGMYNPGNFSSRKDYEFGTHYTNGYHFETGNPSTPKYVDIDSFGKVDASMYVSHSTAPTITLGPGAGTVGTVTVTGDLNNYTVSVTVGGTVTGSATIFTASGYPTFSVNMSPVYSEGSATASILSGAQRPFMTGTTNTHVMTAGSVALTAGVYVFQVICLPKL